MINEHLKAALAGESPDRIPFTIYENKLPRCSCERRLRNKGLLLVRRVRSYRIHRPHVRTKTVRFTDDKGKTMVKTVHDTPEGKLTVLKEPAGFTSWTHEHLFSSPEDYRALRFFIEDAEVEPAYDAVKRVLCECGEDVVVRDNLPLEPLQNLISSYMGVENYSLEWMDNRDEVLVLYRALADLARQGYPVVADGPLDFANYGGNVIPQVVGSRGFRKYYLPHYAEAAEVLHDAGMLIGSHLDADNSPIMEEVAESALDYIEAFDPGMGPSLAEARRLWPDKVIWIHWPSSFQHKSQEEISRRTFEMLRDVSPAAGIIIGLTEDMPEDPPLQWQNILWGIMDGIETFESKD